MAKKKKSDGAQPPSMFDNLDLFDIKSVSENVAPQADDASSKASASFAGLTGSGPMRDLYDFNSAIQFLQMQ